MMSKTLHIAILGVTGYTGFEMLRWACKHPHITLSALTSQQHVTKSLHQVFPHVASLSLALPKLQAHESLAVESVDLIFSCLPHKESHRILKAYADKTRIIDLSADFRLRSPSTYKQWYDNDHSAPELLTTAVYGLSECYRSAIGQARLVANPGCYPTAALLPLIPLLQERLIEADDIIIDAKSALSGAGRKMQTELLFCEAQANMRAYALAGHRHMAEIIEQLQYQHDAVTNIIFTPHVVPLNRGLLATLYVTPKASPATIQQYLTQFYRKDAFVHITTDHAIPHVNWVTNSNHAFIGVSPQQHGNKLVLVSVIDNLVKGAVGQAIHNMNIMFGFAETCGLDALAPRI